MSKNAIEAFELLKRSITNAMVISIDDSVMFTVETDASENAMAAQFSEERNQYRFSQGLSPVLKKDIHLLKKKFMLSLEH
ncbi:hypothetical protein JTB14_016305 [Gonioctena quinquepunctata]|nr:hypothetical protein JTB14_016305 [Gonioctena quinquepunctata]